MASGKFRSLKINLARGVRHFKNNIGDLKSFDFIEITLISSDFTDF